jgi:hypothetical protein
MDFIFSEKLNGLPYSKKSRRLGEAIGQAVQFPCISTNGLPTAKIMLMVSH